ncbi:MAG: threonine/serine ThrE exporter family protein [Fusobacteriaceae bacterium]
MLKKQLLSEQQILQVATFAGKIALTSGAEVYRVEDIISRIGQHFNLNVDCFVTLTCIIVSGKNINGEVVSLVERIKSRSTNLDKIHEIHKIVTDIEMYSLIELKKALQKIDETRPYSFGINLFASALGAASFIISFKGGPNDFAAAFVSGAGVAVFSYTTSGLQLNNFFTNLISSIICVLISNLFYISGVITTPSISIISSLMLLVPGVGFINSIRDIISGDLISGTSRATEVLMTGGAIAIGAGLVTKIFYNFGGI